MTKKLKVLTTGGTIGSALKSDGTVGTSSAAALRLKDNIITQAQSYGAEVSFNEVMNIDSSQGDFASRFKIAQAVKAAIDQGHDRIIITHGTDSMHQTLTMLSLLFSNTKARIVLTGAMNDLDDKKKNSDAPFNIDAAIATALHDDKDFEPGVYLAFQDRNNTRSANIIRGLDVKPAKNDQLPFSSDSKGYIEAHTKQKVYATYTPRKVRPHKRFELSSYARMPTIQQPFLRCEGFGSALIPEDLDQRYLSNVHMIQAEAVGTSISLLSGAAKNYPKDYPWVLVIDGFHSGSVKTGPVKEFLRNNPNARVYLTNYPPGKEAPYSDTADLMDKVKVLCHWQAHQVYELFNVGQALGLSLDAISKRLDQHLVQGPKATAQAHKVVTPDSPTRARAAADTPANGNAPDPAAVLLAKREVTEPPVRKPASECAARAAAARARLHKPKRQPDEPAQ